MTDATYPHAELLASTSWLAEHLDEPQLKILDARGEGEYAEGHVPGALLLPPGAFRATSGVADVCSSEEFAETAGALGISADDLVVCYDAAGPAGARAWWAFARFGHRNVKFLNGGIRQWSSDGRPLSTDATSPEPMTYTLGAPVEDLVCSLPQAVSAVSEDAVLFWDVRSADEFSGASPRSNPPDRAGHIPGAVHLEWSELVNAETGLFKPAAEMERTLAAKGITPESEVVTY